MESEPRNAVERWLVWLGLLTMAYGTCYWIIYKLFLSPEPIGASKAEEFPPILINTLRWLAVGQAVVLIAIRRKAGWAKNTAASFLLLSATVPFIDRVLAGERTFDREMTSVLFFFGLGQVAFLYGLCRKQQWLDAPSH
jgi:hypothetical protein